MSFDLEDGFDPAEMWAEKQRSRDEDRRALESGEKTIEQLREENGVFAQLAPISRVNLSASKPGSTAVVGRFCPVCKEE